MLEHSYRCDIRASWSEDMESFVAAADGLKDFLGIGSTYSDAVMDLELAMGLEEAALRQELREGTAGG